jgi:hypothetical protein
VDAAATLAGDVNAAAEAFENLKLLLQHQLADPARARLESGPDPEARPRLTSLPSQADPMNMRFAATHSPVAPRLPADAVDAASQVPRRLDIRGFLVGFAVSAAIGAALYICLAGG